jgi:hypothetical protein
MTKFKLATLIGTSCLMSLFLFTPAHSNPATVKLTTEPSVAKIAPYEAESTTKQQPVSISLQAIDPQGQPLKAAKIAVKILTPPSNQWFTTDFPIIEGKQLLELTAPAPDGKIQFEQMLPIRGNYQVLVNVTPTDTNIAPFQQTLTFSVAENGIKYQNFAILAGILVAVGATGGWVIGSRQTTQPGEIAPSNVRLLLSGATIIAIASLLYINVSAELAQSNISESMAHAGKGEAHSHMNHAMGSEAHQQMKQDAPAQSPVAKSTLTQSGLKAVLSGDDDSAVGKVAQLRLKVTDAQTNLPVVTAVQIKAVATEGKWTSFGYQGVTDSNGELNWQSGFFDGVPHLVDVTISPTANSGKKFAPIKISKELSVEGVAPPLMTRLIVLGYMTGIVATAFFAAFLLRQKQLDLATVL